MTTERIYAIQRHLQHNNDFRLQNTSGNLETTEMNGLSKFQYTLENPRLTFQQRKFYEENGYLIIRNLIEDDLLDQFTQRFIDMCEDRIERGRVTMMRDISLWKQGAKGELLYYKLQEFNFDPVFSKFITHDKLLDYVECFTGPNIMAVHPMLINKPPDSGKLSTRHPVHQDLHAFPFRPASRIVGAWTAMEEKIDEENGCLFVMPGTHRPGIVYQHDYPDWEGGVNGLYWGVQEFEDAPKTMIHMKKGDTIFFHPLLLHGSGANYTKGFRKSISCHFAASECEFIDMRGNTNEKFTDQLVELMKKTGHLGDEASYVDFWKQRSSVARGKRIHL